MSPSGSRTEEFLERKHSVEFLRIFFYFVSTSKLYVVNANSVMVLTWCRWPVTSHLVWGFKSCFCSKFWIDSSTNHIWRAKENLFSKALLIIFWQNLYGREKNPIKKYSPDLVTWFEGQGFQRREVLKFLDRYSTGVLREKKSQKTCTCPWLQICIANRISRFLWFT